MEGVHVERIGYSGDQLFKNVRSVISSAYFHYRRFSAILKLRRGVYNRREKTDNRVSDVIMFVLLVFLRLVVFAWYSTCYCFP